MCRLTHLASRNCTTLGGRHKTPFHTLTDQSRSFQPNTDARVNPFFVFGYRKRRSKENQSATQLHFFFFFFFFFFGNSESLKQWQRIASLGFLLPTKPPRPTRLRRRGRGKIFFTVMPSFSCFCKLSEIGLDFVRCWFYWFICHSALFLFGSWNGDYLYGVCSAWDFRIRVASASELNCMLWSM